MHRLSFITVTISSRERMIDASTGYKLLLKPYLQKLKRKHGMSTYIWKAEYQQNGQLHYHIVTPSWIHYEKVRNDWNNTLEQHGFLSQWRATYGNKIANSTDIHAVYKVHNLEAYLMKYLSKKSKILKDSNKGQEFYQDETAAAAPPPVSKRGKIWDCSKNIKSVKLFSLPLPNCLEKFYEDPERISLDKCIIIKSTCPKVLLPPGLQRQYKKWQKGITTPN